ncbi:MAG: glycosyltransferase, partial [Endomicrobium sp.]|nr:glycosyltransferase [Endomicrobium sp.]
MKKNEYKVSVIIPVYNVEPYVKDCLDSVVNQTLKDIEIVCVNDGSTDNSWRVLEEYAARDSRIKIITQANQGLACARNNGIKVAKGEYIGFVDSDDWISLDFYEKLYDNAKIENADVCVGNVKSYINGNTQPYFNIEHFGIANDKDKKRIISTNICWNKIYRRSMIEEHQL